MNYILPFIIAMLCAVVVAVYDTNEKTTEKRPAQLAPLGAHSEYIKTTGIKVSTSESAWVTAESSDWLLANGDQPSDFCPSALRNFTEANDLSAPSLAEMRIIESGYRDKPMELHVVVPRFKVAPDGLQDCLGFGHDPATGMLTVGDKKVAYLLEQQPRLRAAP